MIFFMPCHAGGRLLDGFCSWCMMMSWIPFQFSSLVHMQDSVDIGMLIEVRVISEKYSNVTIMCRNDELSWTMSWIGCLLTDKVLKSIHFNTQLHNPHFFQNCGSFQYNNSWLCFDVSWCCIEKYHNFEINEECATVFLKWTDFTR